VGGLTLPAATTVNVAGTRALVGGGFAFVADDVLAGDVVVDVVEAPRLPLLDVVDAPPPPLVDVVEAPPPFVPDPAGVVEVTDVEDVVAAVAAVVLEACTELPHDASSTAKAIATKRRAGRLTFSA